MFPAHFLVDDILFCSAPVGAGYMFCLVSLYIMKYATDVLLIAPASMGLIFGFSRFWDAISDPLAGYLSIKPIRAGGDDGLGFSPQSCRLG